MFLEFWLFFAFLVYYYEIFGFFTHFVVPLKNYKPPKTPRAADSGHWNIGYLFLIHISDSLLILMIEKQCFQTVIIYSSLSKYKH